MVKIRGDSYFFCVCVCADVVRAYKGVLKEKEALETTLKALSVQQEEEGEGEEGWRGEGEEGREGEVTEEGRSDGEVERKEEVILLCFVCLYLSVMYVCMYVCMLSACLYVGD